MKLGGLLLVSPVLSVAASGAVQEACKALSDALPQRVNSEPTSDTYLKTVESYWSAVLRTARPGCIVYAESAQDVATAVRVLQPFDNVKFAVRAGGTDPNMGHGSINDGVLITLEKLHGAKYPPDTQTVLVKPGGNWGSVTKELEPHGVALAAGRLSNIGIGGFVAGGGLSYLSPQHGLAGDTVLEFETVFPNGSIGSVTRDSHPTLFRAMKGSYNNYGIVTQFTMRAIPMSKVFGGSNFYLGQQDRILEALEDFTENSEDPKASVIVQLYAGPVGSSAAMIMFFYHAAQPPPGAFRKFEALSAIKTGTKTQSFYELISSTGDTAQKMPTRASFRTMMLPVIAEDRNVTLLKEIVHVWRNSYQDASAAVIKPLVLQPFQNMIGKAAEEAGGNIMGISGSDGNRILLVSPLIWMLSGDDQPLASNGRAMEARMKDVMQDVVTEAVRRRMTDRDGATVEQKSKIESYMPDCINHANGDQPALKNLKDYAVYKKLQRDVDPDGFFDRRLGGYKL